MNLADHFLWKKNMVAVKMVSELDRDLFLSIRLVLCYAHLFRAIITVPFRPAPTPPLPSILEMTNDCAAKRNRRNFGEKIESLN